MAGLQEMLAMMGGGRNGRPEATSKNPADYPWANEITDERSVGLVTEVKRLEEEITDLMERVKEMQLQHQLMVSQLWRALKVSFPGVKQWDSLGYRTTSDGRHWAVAWDAENEIKGTTYDPHHPMGRETKTHL